MNNLAEYIQEKLIISSDAAAEFKKRQKYFTVDIADDIHMPKWAYDYRKTKKGDKNRLWYAVYCYIYLNGPAKVDDIISILKPGNKGYSYFFNALRKYNVIAAGTGKDRGLQFICDPSEWQDFRNDSYIS